MNLSEPSFLTIGCYMRLLYAEDEPDLNRIVTKKLADEGFSVDSCFDGREAIDNIQFTDYDVAILDIILP